MLNKTDHLAGEPGHGCCRQGENLESPGITRGPAARHCRNPAAKTLLTPFAGGVGVCYISREALPLFTRQLEPHCPQAAKYGGSTAKESKSPYKWPNRYLTAGCRRNNPIISMSLGLGSSSSIPSTNSLISTYLPRGPVTAVQSSLPGGYSLANLQDIISHQIMG